MLGVFFGFQEQKAGLYNLRSYKSMAEEVPSLGKELNKTFLPSSIIRKNESKLATTLNSKYQFQKTTGNPFISIDPPEIKFAGYELDKSYSLTVRVINQAPIPQRITIIPPESQAFAIKTNKKGSIAPGMSETITVVFRSAEHKYQTDVVSIRTETENFIVPLYAYPTLPNLRAIFPKLIDFGAVECREPSTYFYPIVNSVPLNFEFQFHYQKESPEISINPLQGVIQAHQTLTVEVTFVPATKCTSTAEVYLQIQQFDFQPLNIKIIGSGVQKNAFNQSKRIKSSKLTPLREGEESLKKTPQPLLKRPSREGSNMSATQKQLAASINFSQTGPIVMKKSHIRTSFPKLMSAKRTLMEEDTKPLNPSKIDERDYLNRFTRVQDLDKEKEIKFAQFLGDKAMIESQVNSEKELVEEIQKVRMQCFLRKCTERHNPELSSDVGVEFKIVTPQTVSWDDKQNDEHHHRRKALVRFMNAGSKVILKYRMLKRLARIREFIGESSTKEEVKKLVDESHSKALDQQQGISMDDCQLTFGFDSLQPTFFELQLEDSNEKLNKVLLKPDGKTDFDDLTELKEVQTHGIDKFKFAELQNPSDFFNHTSCIPSTRQSAEEEYFFKTAGLDSFTADSLTSAYTLPIKVPAHHFIYDDQSIKQYQNYISCDEKDPEVNLENSLPIEDEFEGWTGGEFEILKYKFTRNIGCPYTTFSGFNFSSERHSLPPEATLMQGLPKLIEEPSYEDTIENGDSDEEILEETPVEASLKFLDQIEGNNADLKERHSKNQVQNPERSVRQQIELNLENQQLKGVGEYIGRVMQANKWVQHTEHRFLL